MRVGWGVWGGGGVWGVGVGGGGGGGGRVGARGRAGVCVYIEYGLKPHPNFGVI